MFTLTELTTRVSNKINLSSADFQEKIKDWLDERYSDIWDRAEWKAGIKTRDSGVVFVSGSPFLILPDDVDELIVSAERSVDRVLSVTDNHRLWTNAVTSIDNSGKPRTYAKAGIVQYKAQPTTSAVLQIVSSLGTDTTQQVRLTFVSSGVEISETLTLNGTSTVDTTASCDIGGFIAVVKDTTNGTVTVTADAGAVTIGVVTAGLNTVYFQRLRVLPVPDAADTLSITYKKKRNILTDNLDTPDFDCTNALITGAYADALFEQKQHQRGALQEQKYESLILRLLDKADNQGEEFEQSRPHIEQRGLNVGAGSFRQLLGDS